MADNMTSPAPKPHVVMMPYPLQGHITPLMQLSKLLASRGFAITFVTSEFNVKQMLKAKQELMVSELNESGITLVGIADGLLELHERECMIQPEDFLASLHFLHTSFDGLVGRMVQEEGLTITCIISDSFLIWTQDVANKWHIPRVSFWPNSLTAFSCSISLPYIMAACPNLDPFKAEVYESASPKLLLNCIPGISEIDTCRLPFHTLDGDRSAEWLRHHVQSQMERVNEPLCIIANSFPYLESEIHMQLKQLLPSKPIFTLGPLLPSSFLGGQHDSLVVDKGTGANLHDEDEECMQWLDLQSPRSVLYISLGSVAVLEEREIQEIALGLEASQQPFLWVLRSITCESALLLNKMQGKVIRWAPQLRVLSHESVGGFLTHCGWNSTLESVIMGVPVIGWPQMMDQITNCWFLVEKLKVGMRLPLDESKRLTRAGVEKGVRKLMQEEEGLIIRVRASKFHTSARSAFTTSLPSNLDSFVNTILSSYTNRPSLQGQE